MIVLYNPRATRPRSRRLPLSLLSLAAVLEGREEYAIVDGNVDAAATETTVTILTGRPVELLAVTVMPGPQTVSAVETCRQVRARFPQVPIVWGGYFPSNYTDAALNAPYVDFAVRGQGEETFLELLAARRGQRSLEGILGLSYKEDGTKQRHNGDRPLRDLDDFPWYPYNRIPADKYLLPTFLGKRTAVHQASIGCPFSCSFCGVVNFSGSREKMESPVRTAEVLRHLAQAYGADACQFYDNNFFLREDHARELADRLAPLQLRWWCQGRIDILLRYADATLEALRRAGCTMVFLGAESGSNQQLTAMNKGLKAEQTLELAARLRQAKIIPEFSFILGSPQDPEGEAGQGFAVIRKIKRLNPEAEIVIEHYTPVPQREQPGGGQEQLQFPNTPDEWATQPWQRFCTQKDSVAPWLKPRTKRLIDNFELVVSSRWPTAQDIRLPAWGRLLLKILSHWRYGLRVYWFPLELRWAQRFLALRKPKEESL